MEMRATEELSDTYYRRISVSHMNQRLSESARLGFKTCILPKSGSEKLDVPAGLTVYRVRNIREAIEVAL